MPLLLCDCLFGLFQHLLPPDHVVLALTDVLERRAPLERGGELGLVLVCRHGPAHDARLEHALAVREGHLRRRVPERAHRRLVLPRCLVQRLFAQRRHARLLPLRAVLHALARERARELRRGLVVDRVLEVDGALRLQRQPLPEQERAVRVQLFLATLLVEAARAPRRARLRRRRGLSGLVAVCGFIALPWGASRRELRETGGLVLQYGSGLPSLDAARPLRELLPRPLCERVRRLLLLLSQLRTSVAVMSRAPAPI